MDRAGLYERIDARVEAIAAAGARDEVRHAVEMGASRTARKALGFDELSEGDVEGLKRRTRNYAKRQLTWLRKLPGAMRIDVTGRSPAQVADEMHRRLRAWPAPRP
jgi:tRNA dimethylallyltransferase